jgi:hypothetical protein
MSENDAQSHVVDGQSLLIVGVMKRIRSLHLSRVRLI